MSNLHRSHNRSIRSIILLLYGIFRSVEFSIVSAQSPAATAIVLCRIMYSYVLVSNRTMIVHSHIFIVGKSTMNAKRQQSRYIFYARFYDGLRARHFQSYISGLHVPTPITRRPRRTRLQDSCVTSRHYYIIRNTEY